MILEEIITKIKKFVKDVDVYSVTSKTCRVDISVNSFLVRKQKTQEVLALFPGSSVTKERPHDVKIPGGFTVLVKPSKTAKRTSSSAYYGLLENIDLSAFKLNSFSKISTEFASGKLVTNIKESSDAKCVSELNEEIVKASKGNLEGITLKIHGFTFHNVIGCIPITNGEPKADAVLVCKKGSGELVPDCFISYKMGSTAKDFQNYSGLSEKSSSYIFNHPETLKFYQLLANLSAAGNKEDVFQVINDRKIIGIAVWGMDFGKSEYGINNCHFMAQGIPKISGNILKYTHSQKNGDFNFGLEYQPVFGARYTMGRGNKGPGGIVVNNFRIGIFPRAYRAKWLK